MAKVNLRKKGYCYESDCSVMEKKYLGKEIRAIRFLENGKKLYNDRTFSNYIYPMGVNYGFMIQIVLK